MINGVERLRLIKNQLLAKTGTETDLSSKNSKLISFKTNKNPLNKWRKKSNFDATILEELYFPYHREFRDSILKILVNNPEFKHYSQHEMSLTQIRELTMLQMKVLMREINKFSSFKEIRSDVRKFCVFVDCLASFDLGLAVKVQVHGGLYYNSLKNLSTIQHQAYLERCLNFEDLGCFALTEFAHGSNVRELKTTATYDEIHKEFVIHSPNYDAYKWWIGGAGKSANMASVFAQLYVKGICQGVHGFLVPLRNKKDNLPFPGVIIGDCGPKIGNENIDNGFIGFTNYRIPRESLLNKFSQISEDGVFSSPIANPDKRFATALGALEEGRITVAAGAQVLLRNALVLGTRFAALRKQFGKEDGEELPILNYPATQIRLIPSLAEHFAFRFAEFDLLDRHMENAKSYSEVKSEKVEEMHALLSVMKPIFTHQAQAKIQLVREVLGGHGYSRLNMIGTWRNNNDVNVTWEGDNNVLIQQASRFVANNLEKLMKGKEIKFKSLSFLKNFKETHNNKIVINDSTELRKIVTLTNLMEQKINILLQKSVGKLAERLVNKETQFDAWNNSQIFYMQSMTKAFGELYVFICFKDKVESMKDSPTKTMLQEMLILFALVNIEKDLVILRENDYVMSEVGDLIKDEILKICSVLKDQLVSIIDVIAPPDEVHGAPLGSANGFIFEKYLNLVFGYKGCFERVDWWENIHPNKNI